MMLAKRNIWLAVGLVAVLQAAALVWMIWERNQLLENGREIVLQVIPRDPRSLFQGDYVNLDYPISRVETPAGTKPPRHGATLYVTLRKNADGTWEAAGVGAERPARIGPDEVLLKGRVTYTSTGNATTPAIAGLKYGIENYFVPEGTGRDLETLVGEKKLAVLVAVDEDGNAGIKGLVVDGKQVYEEPLF